MCIRDRFQDALQLITHTRQSVFLTGKAGTGKSTFLKYICNHTKKKYVVLAFQSGRMGFASAIGTFLFVVIMIFTLLSFKIGKKGENAQ